MVTDSYNLILDANLYSKGFYSKDILKDNYDNYTKYIKKDFMKLYEQMIILN